MKYRAIIQKTGEWWIGWLVDLPGVNGQEKTKEELLESLRIGAEDMLQAEVEIPPNGQMELVEIPL
jgi:predicted RNase H-like HicB family nuclease